MLFKISVLIFFLVSHILADEYSDFKNALNSDQYEKALDIYVLKIGQEDTDQYKNYLFSTVIKKLKNDTSAAETLLQEYLNIQFNDPMGLYILSEIKLVEDNYDESLGILYQLQNSYLDESLTTKVNSKLSRTIDAYLNILSKEQNMGKLDEVVNQFYSNNDVKALGKWQKILMDIASHKEENKEYSAAKGILEKLENYQMDESVNLEYQTLVNSLEKIKNNKKLKGLIE